MGGKKINTSLRSTPMKQGFSQKSVDDLLSKFNLLASAKGRQGDITQTQVADIDPAVAKQRGLKYGAEHTEVDENTVKNITTAVRKRENEILLRRNQPGEAQTRLLQNATRL